MNQVYLVRTGQFGDLDNFACTLPHRLEPGARVICRTIRGLEVGQVLGQGINSKATAVPVAQILRPVNQQDELIIARLDRFRTSAISSCEELLRQKGICATLLDAEQLFDGHHLIFYFCDDSDPAVDEVLSELAEKYDRSVGFSRFAKVLAEGCGPKCGTSVCGSATSACSNCALGGCAPRGESHSPRIAKSGSDSTL